jgi:hypothetical protein
MHVGGCRRLICVKGDVGAHVEMTIPIQVSPLKGNAIEHGRDREVGVMKGLGCLYVPARCMDFLRLLCFASAGFASLDLALGTFVDEPMRARMT